MKSWERFNLFNATPCISPHPRLFTGGTVIKLRHFRKEFALPEKLNVVLLKYPGIFYVTDKYQIYTVHFREGYNGSDFDLINKGLLVVKLMRKVLMNTITDNI